MVLMTQPLANANARQAALAIEDAGLLSELWTCLHWTPGSPVDRLMPAVLARELGRRAWPEAVRRRVHTVPVREAARLLASRVPGARWLTRHEAGCCSVDAVFQALDRAAAQRVGCAPEKRENAARSLRLRGRRGGHVPRGAPAGHPVRVRPSDRILEREPGHLCRGSLRGCPPGLPH